MDAHRESIWQRDLAWVITKEARRRFKENVGEDPIGAHVALASTHYSLIKRYTARRKFLVVWHAWRAAAHANRAIEISHLKYGPSLNLSFDQADVVAAILAKVPTWLGGFPAGSVAILHSALFLSDPKKMMKPHTRALMLITLGEIEWRLGKKEAAEQRHDEARCLIAAIETEVSDDRNRQLIRVLKKVGFFYFNSTHPGDMEVGEKLLMRATDLAREHSRDQYDEITLEWAKRRRAKFKKRY